MGGKWRGRGRGSGSGSGRGIRRGLHGHRGDVGFRGRRGGGGLPSADRPQHKKFSLVGGPRLAETDVGITEFISKHQGFEAVVKHRFSDFQVNEIDCDGNVVKLTSQELPQEYNTTAERHELIPEDIWAKLASLAKEAANYVTGESEKVSPSIALLDPPKYIEKNGEPGKDSPPPTTSVGLENDLEKAAGSGKGSQDVTLDSQKVLENNSKLDQEKKETGTVEKTNISLSEEKSVSLSENCSSTKDSVVSKFPSSNKEHKNVELDVTALDKDGRRAIHNCVKRAFKQLNGNTIDKDGKKFVVFSLGKDARGRQNRGKWPESRSGEYCYFVVHKRNMDTTQTVNLISQKLGLRPNVLTFAGTKDKRGVTSQLMSIWKGEPSRLYHLNKGLSKHCVNLGNFCFKTKPLRLGDLNGNQFRIALRNVQGSNEQIISGLESLKNNGFINYYGLQRFGSNINVPTHTVGKALLYKDWKKAVDLILEPRVGSHINLALEEWKSSKDPKAALQKISHRTYCLEESLLEGLARHGPNDIVNALSMIPLNTQLMYLHAYQSLIWNRTVSQRVREFGLQPIVGDLVLIKSEKVDSLEVCTDTESAANDSDFQDAIEVLVEETNTKQQVRCITEEDVKNYKIDDVVLPLPGYDVMYPNNSIGDFIKELLKEDGLSSDSFQHQVKRFAMKGAYRHILSRANNLSWNIVQYNNPDSDLILSDREELMGRDAFKNVEDGKYKAVVLTMSLDVSTYATMALREITKTDTSAATQALMSAAAAKVESDKDADGATNNIAEMKGPDGPSEVTVSEESESASSVMIDISKKETQPPAEHMDEDVENESSGVKRRAGEPVDTVEEKRIKENEDV